MLKIDISFLSRSLLKRKKMAILKLLNWIIGIVGFALLSSYAYLELGYDQIHPNSDRLYRASQTILEGDKEYSSPRVSAGLASLMYEDFDEVEDYASVLIVENLFIYKDSITREYVPNAYFGSESFFNIFGFPLIEGHKDSVLLDSGNVVLSRVLSNKLFGDISGGVIGRKINTRYGNYTVTGIFDADLGKTHFKPELILSSATMGKNYMKSFGSYDVYQYLLLKEGASIDKFTKGVNENKEKYMPQNYSRGGVGYFKFLNVRDIHLGSNELFEMEVNGDFIVVMLVIIAGVFLLVVAFINHFSITSSEAKLRKSEIVFRKQQGALKKDISSLLLNESFIWTFLFSIICLPLIWYLFPLFSDMMELNPTIVEENRLGFMLICFAILFVVGFGAWRVSLAVLNHSGMLRNDNIGRNYHFQNIIVTLQVTVAIALLSFSYIIYDQIDFVMNKDSGMDTEDVLVIIMDKKDNIKFPELRDAFQVDDDVIEAAGLSENFALHRGMDYFKFEEDSANWKSLLVEGVNANQDFLKLLKVPVLAGKHFDKPSTGCEVVVNETLARALGYEDYSKLVGKKVDMPYDHKFDIYIVGVVGDFQVVSNRTPTAPFVVVNAENKNFHVLLKLKKNINEKLLIDRLKKAYLEILPTAAFRYEYLDDLFETHYLDDKRNSDIFKAFSLLLLFMSCIGIWSSITFYDLTHRKNIAIRAMLGAGFWDLYYLLSRPFFKTLILAVVFGVAFSFYFSNFFLDEFSSRIPIQAIHFLFPIGLAVSLVFFSVFLNVGEITRSSPAKAINN